MITSQMASLQLSLSERDDWDRIRLVTISVDPEHDTPQVLTRYAGWAHADPRQWLFLTGSRQEVWTLIQRGFKLPVGEADDNPQEPIFHSQSLVLVDPHGRVRGVYRAIDERLPDGHVAPHEREDLLAALDRVLAEE